MAKMAAAITYFGRGPRERHQKAGGTGRKIGAPGRGRGLSAPPAIAREKNDVGQREESFWMKV